MTEGQTEASPEEVAGPRSGSLRSKVAQTTVTNFAIAGVGVATGLIAARVLGPEGRGELAAIFSWPMLFAGLATVGMPEAIVYFCARMPKRAGTHFITALMIALAASILFTGVGWLLMPIVLHAQDAEVVTTARWYLVSVPLAATLGIADRPLRGIGDFRSWNLMRAAPTMAWLIILLVALARGSASPEGLAIAFLLARLALVGPILRFVRNRIQGRWTIDRSLARPMLRFGLPAFVTVLPMILNQRLDQLMMAAFLPAKTLGIYVVAVAWSGMLTPALLGFANVMFPTIAGGGLSEERRIEIFTKGMRVGTLLAIALGIGVAAVTPFLLPLVFGASFKAAVTPALVLVVAAAIAGINLIGEEGLLGLGRPMLVLRAEACGLVVTLIGLGILLGRFALLGAAVASLAGYTTTLALIVYATSAISGRPARKTLVPGRADLAILVTNLVPGSRRARR